MAKLLRSPDVAELRAFCLAADLGSLGRAAVALRTSQPALSKRLRTLEAIAGTELFERSPSGVTLTEAGRRLYPEARKLLDQADVVAELLGRFGGGEGPVRLAVSHTIAEFHLAPELVAHQTGAGQHLAVELTAGNSQAVRGMVAEGRADLGIAANRLPTTRPTASRSSSCSTTRSSWPFRKGIRGTSATPCRGRSSCARR
jgi:DNA-binding transcriptional LysR family regulator